MDFEYSPRTKELQAQLMRFMDDYIYPAEKRYDDELEANTKAGKRWTPLKTIEELKPKARAQGLWNLFLPPTAGGKGSRASGLANDLYGASQCNKNISPTLGRWRRRRQRKFQQYIGSRRGRRRRSVLM